MLSVRSLRVLLSALLALVVAVVLASCGGDSADSKSDQSSKGSSSVGTLADAFPETTLAYLEATVRPDGELAENAKTIIGKLTGKSPDEVGAFIEKELNADTEPGEASWDEVKQFLGKRIAVGALSIDGKLTDANADDLTAEGGIVIEITDAAAAEKSLAKDSVKKDLNGQAYYVSNEDDSAFAIVDKRAIGGMTESAFKTMMEAQKASTHLSDTDVLKKAAGEVSGDPLLFGFFEGKPLIDRIRELADPEAQKQLDLALKTYGQEDLGTYGLTATFGKKSVGFDFFAVGVKTEDQGGKAADLIKGLPDDAWLAFGVNAFGKQLSKGLKSIKDLGTVDGTDFAAEIAQVEQQLGLNLEQDLFSWMGDVALFARGTSADTANGALVVNSTDAAASEKAIKDIGRIAGQAGLAPKPVDVDGAKGIAIAAGPVTVTIVQQGDKLTIATTEQAARDALAPGGTLGDSSSFKTAGEELNGIDPMLFLSFAPVTELAQESGDLSAEDKRILEALDSIIVGSTLDGDAGHLKAALLVK